MSDLFHPDGCVRANIPVKQYHVMIAGKCEHTKVVAGMITVTAESGEDAMSYVSKWLNIPQTVVTGVIRAPA